MRTSFFEKIIAETPKEISLFVDYSFAISDKIYAAMQEKNISAAQLAAMTNYTEEDVRIWIGGGYNFDIELLAKISAVLEIELL